MNELQCLMVTPSAPVLMSGTTVQVAMSGVKHQMAFLIATIEQNLQFVCGVRCVTSVRWLMHTHIQMHCGRHGVTKFMCHSHQIHQQQK